MNIEGQMEVDNDTTHETTLKQFKISPDAPTVLIVMGMAGSGKTTFVHVSDNVNHCVETNCLFKREGKIDLQPQFRSCSIRSTFPLQHRHT